MHGFYRPDIHGVNKVKFHHEGPEDKRSALFYSEYLSLLFPSIYSWLSTIINFTCNHILKQALLGEKCVFLLRWLNLLSFNPLCIF
jgi:hypothetical protein